MGEVVSLVRFTAISELCLCCRANYTHAGLAKAHHWQRKNAVAAGAGGEGDAADASVTASSSSYPSSSSSAAAAAAGTGGEDQLPIWQRK